MSVKKYFQQEDSTPLLLYFTAKCKTVDNQLVPLWHCGVLVHVWPHVTQSQHSYPVAKAQRSTLFMERRVETFKHVSITSELNFCPSLLIYWNFYQPQRLPSYLRQQKTKQSHKKTQQHNFGTDKHIDKLSMLFFSKHKAHILRFQTLKR